MADKDFKVKQGLDLGIPLSIADGGTGQTTAENALNALLPVQTDQSSKFLTTDGTNATWAPVSSYSAPTIGSTQITSGSTVTSITGLNEISVNQINGISNFSTSPNFLLMSSYNAVASYSSNGVTWTAITLPVAKTWNALAYGNGRYIAIGAFGTDAMIYSTDGINWTQGTSPTSTIYTLSYGNGNFLAISNTGTPYTSTNGVVWTQRTFHTTISIGSTYNNARFANGKFIVLDNNNSTTASVSTDGITWSAGTMPVAGYWSSLTYGNGKYVAIAQSETKAAYSTDGFSWTLSTLPSSRNWYDIAYGNGRFVAMGKYSSEIAVSTDGITWTAYTIQQYSSFQNITFGNGKFVISSTSSQDMPSSTDGITWTFNTNTASSFNGAMVYGDLTIEDKSSVSVKTLSVTDSATLPSLSVTNAMLAGSISKTKITGTAITTEDTGTVTNTMLAGSIANAKLANSSMTLNGTVVSLGGSATIPGAVTKIGTYSGSTSISVSNLPQTYKMISGKLRFFQGTATVGSYITFTPGTGSWTGSSSSWGYGTQAWSGSLSNNDYTLYFGRHATNSSYWIAGEFFLPTYSYSGNNHNIYGDYSTGDSASTRGICGLSLTQGTAPTIITGITITLPSGSASATLELYGWS